jgi:hypothetical protein
MEYWWDDTDKGKPKYSDKNLIQCPFVHGKSYAGWPRPKPGFRETVFRISMTKGKLLFSGLFVYTYKYDWKTYMCLSATVLRKALALYNPCEN